MRCVGARFSDNVDGSATCTTEIGGIVAAIDLEFLHGILTYVQTDSACIIVRLAPVDGDAVASAVASIKREAALRCLFHAEIGIVG